MDLDPPTDMNQRMDSTPTQHSKKEGFEQTEIPGEAGQSFYLHSPYILSLERCGNKFYNTANNKFNFQPCDRLGGPFDRKII
jgi:hypothetical protein